MTLYSMLTQFNPEYPQDKFTTTLKKHQQIKYEFQKIDFN